MVNKKQKKKDKRRRLPKRPNKNANGLLILHVNCRSLQANFTHFTSFINYIDRDTDVICLTETWLNDNIDTNLLSIEGYSYTHSTERIKKVERWQYTQRII